MQKFFFSSSLLFKPALGNNHSYQNARCFVAVISLPSLRHNNVQKGFRNHYNGPLRSRALARLSFLGRNNCVQSSMQRFLVWTIGGKHPIGRFREMSCNRAYRDSISFGGPKPSIELRNMTKRYYLMPQGNAVCGFNKCPMQVMIDITRRVPIANLLSRCMDGRSGARIRCQV
jgi:hypothetical protein